MTFVTTWPDGTKSVKVNETAGAANMAYIQTKQRLDHYWGEGSVDGYHRKMDMPKSASAPALVNNGVLFAQDTSDLVTQTFYTNTSATYQVTPGILTGTTGTISSKTTYSNVVAVPANVYGEIFMYQYAMGAITLGKYTAQTGFFRSNGSVVETWATGLIPEGDSNTYNLKFGNGSKASFLTIQARRNEAISTTWKYIVTYRDL